MEDIMVEEDVMRCPQCRTPTMSKTKDEKYFECSCGCKVLNFGNKEVKDEPS